MDCKFSHDLASIPCRFFAEGACFKSVFCPFMHALPEPDADKEKDMSITDGEELVAKICGSLDSIGVDACSPRGTSESDSGLQAVEKVVVNLAVGSKPSSASKRKRCKTRQKKNAPNVKDKVEFPCIANIPAVAVASDVKDASLVCDPGSNALSLGSIYPVDVIDFTSFTSSNGLSFVVLRVQGFAKFANVAVM